MRSTLTANVIRVSLLSLIPVIAACRGPQSVHQTTSMSDRLLGTWNVDWQSSRPLVEKKIQQQSGKAPTADIDEALRSVRGQLKTKQIVFDRDSLSYGLGERVRYKVIEQESDYLLIREYWKGHSEITSSNPQKVMDQYAMKLPTVPLFTGFKLIDENRFQMYKLKVREGKVTGEKWFSDLVYVRKLRDRNVTPEGSKKSSAIESR